MSNHRRIKMSKTARDIAEGIMNMLVGRGHVFNDQRSIQDAKEIITFALIEYAKAEREACARIAEDLLSRHEWSPKTAIGALQDVARRIRERGE